MKDTGSALRLSWRRMATAIVRQSTANCSPVAPINSSFPLVATATRLTSYVLRVRFHAEVECPRRHLCPVDGLPGRTLVRCPSSPDMASLRRARCPLRAPPRLAVTPFASRLRVAIGSGAPTGYTRGSPGVWPSCRSVQSDGLKERTSEPVGFTVLDPAAPEILMGNGSLIALFRDRLRPLVPSPRCRNPRARVLG